jgi:Ca-activated chloride channel family protein
MSLKLITKVVVVVGFLLLASWRVASHPAYQNMYANDPRSKPEFRTDCTICHAVEGKASQPNFLSEFGLAFKANRNRLSEQLRGQFPRLFNAQDSPVLGLPVETIKLSTVQVVINISVTDTKGKFVSGLDKEAFTLTEDQQQQDMVEFLGEDAPLAVAVLIDTSGSALEQDLQKARNAVLDLANRLRPNDVLAVYTFGESGVQMVRDYSQGVRDLKPILKQLKGHGNTPLYDAILDATEDLRQRPERRRALVLISDGADSDSQATLREAETQTFLAGVSIYAIDLINTQKSARRSAQRQASAQVLQQLAEVTGGRYITTEGGFFLLTSRAKLKRIFSGLIDEWHSQYTVIYEPNNMRQQGRWRTLRVQMEQADMTARTRLGYREAAQ